MHISEKWVEAVQTSLHIYRMVMLSSDVIPVPSRPPLVYFSLLKMLKHICETLHGQHIKIL